MESAEQIKRLRGFLETNCKPELFESIRKGEWFLVVDFTRLLKYDPDIAEELLEMPEDVLKAAEIAVSEVVDKELKKFELRFKNLPAGQKIMIRNIRSEHIGKFLMVDGIVRQKSDVRPQVTSARFECPSCGNVIGVLQLDSSFKEPSSCGCGRKGKFRLLSKELIDVQGIVLEESPEKIEGGEQPKRMNIFLKDDLVSPMSEKKTNPGSKIIVVGQVKEIPIINRAGKQSTRFDLLIEANYVEATQETFYEVQISAEEEKKIKKIAEEGDVYQKLVNSVAPSIYGYDKIKESLLIQLVGGVQKERSDGMVTRGDIHILLVGDPGSGKSQLLKRIQRIAPKGRYVSGKGVSGAGLTAAVVRDEFLKGWSLEAGALVLASNGLCCIDELDKMSVEDRSAMHEALEQQTVSISKANIQATLLARTTVLAAANPKMGRFDQYEILAKQINLPPALINRFDLIFPIKDLPEKSRDEKMASHILELHKSPDVEEGEISTEMLRKYIAYAKQKLRPSITSAALEEIKEFYVDMRNKEVAEEGVARAIAMSPRQLEALVRMAEASAKLRLSDKVTKRDARRAIELLQYCLSQVGIDPETGKVDIDVIATGISASKRGRIVTVQEIINELENKIGKTIPIEDILKEAEARNIKGHEVEELLEKMRREGEIFEPKRGFIQRI